MIGYEDKIILIDLESCDVESKQAIYSMHRLFAKRVLPYSIQKLSILKFFIFKI